MMPDTILLGKNCVVVLYNNFTYVANDSNYILPFHAKDLVHDLIHCKIIK
jgi:hypothetical protein